MLSQARLLVVDDDDHLRAVLLDQLKREGVGFLAECDRTETVPETVTSFRPDLILLDVQLPDGSGYEVCAQLRAAGFTRPILMLTGQNEEAHVIEGLESGANDYIAKPMRMGELLARIRTHLKTFQASDAVRFTIVGLDFIPANRTLSQQNGGQKAVLTEKETMILKNLVRAWPEGIDKTELLSEVWGYQSGLSTHTLETHIYRLRQKIARLTDLPVIRTTGLGYCLEK